MTKLNEAPADTITLTWEATVVEIYTATVPRVEYLETLEDGSTSNWLAGFEEEPVAFDTVDREVVGEV